MNQAGKVKEDIPYHIKIIQNAIYESSRKSFPINWIIGSHFVYTSLFHYCPQQ